jgi:hypothetical protein
MSSNCLLNCTQRRRLVCGPVRPTTSSLNDGGSIQLFFVLLLLLHFGDVRSGPKCPGIDLIGGVTK